jgi:putative NADH-flavin reductase
MKIVVVGASGMVGSRVVAEAVTRGHEITAVSRGHEITAASRGRAAPPSPSGVTPVPSSTR